jgi:hypothetical protein
MVVRSTVVATVLVETLMLLLALVLGVDPSTLLRVAATWVASPCKIATKRRSVCLLNCALLATVPPLQIHQHQSMHCLHSFLLVWLPAMAVLLLHMLLYSAAARMKTAMKEAVVLAAKATVVLRVPMGEVQFGEEHLQLKQPPQQPHHLPGDGRMET